MADNQLNTFSTMKNTFALPAHAVVSLQGVDAIAFAQAQFANDVAALAAGNWQWNCWLTAKGRVIALFALAKTDENSLLLLLPDYPADALAGQLRRYVFRKKVKIEARDDLRVAASFAAPALARDSRLYVEGESIELDFGGDGGARTLRISPQAAGADAALASQWRAFDLQHGLLHLAESQREQWTPQQLSLERLPAFSVKKGCYPGQEIVARTHFLGKAKRGLALIETNATPQVDGEIFANGASIGKIVDVIGNQALAVLPLEREPAALQVAGIDARELPLRDGLKR